MAELRYLIIVSDSLLRDRRALAEAASAPPSLELATTAAQITHYFHLPEQLYKWVQYVIESLGIIPRVEIKMRLSWVTGVDEEFVNRLVRSRDLFRPNGFILND